MDSKDVSFFAAVALVGALFGKVLRRTIQDEADAAARRAAKRQADA